MNSGPAPAPRKLPSRSIGVVAVVLALALIEWVGASTIRARVPSNGDWEAVAAHVLANWRDHDIAIAAPPWAEPLLRMHLGARLSVQDAGRADLAPYERVWELSIHGHVAREVEGRAPVRVARFGAVTLREYELGPTTLRYDLTSRIAEAHVSAGERACRLMRRSPEGGGLFQGPMKPGEHFFCGPQPWLWVGATVMEDLDLQNRYCIWQHPRDGGEATTTTFEDVPLGESIVLHAGLYYAHERIRQHGPVTLRVLVDGEEVGMLVHRDGDGWERMWAATRPTGGPARGDVSIVVTADDPTMRTVCWAASIRDGERP